MYLWFVSSLATEFQSSSSDTLRLAILEAALEPRVDVTGVDLLLLILLDAVLLTLSAAFLMSLSGILNRRAKRSRTVLCIEAKEDCPKQ